ncbi:MAG: tRNA (adenosine(37)-N6)-threonylcarbamoyltransferase complex dimerization subunit type 1 TsaB [Chitinophagales bacterium]|nr:tRNA (adenosine(37)-N6)-threonylcarbamoyltransferase complex dimerization subunit type 1 TsaB [Bacteroidota bacterium]MCB9042357.1 tRNA (adenosine(37)-N6)-threonylcarbamoyltransferase complex dimerization subunit type 1 TsaB [Chitinophagales bacterium]
MSKIICLETSGKDCSVALAQAQRIIVRQSQSIAQSHSASINIMLQAILQQSQSHWNEIAAIAVSIGPGSYTGLRVGLSTAKGVAYALKIPIVGINTLRIIARAAQQKAPNNTIYLPMIDARRMEVFCAAYTTKIQEIMSPKAYILHENSFAELREKWTDICICGSGAEKAKNFLTDPKFSFQSATEYYLDALAELAFEAYSQQQFLDLAYATPFYLKAFGEQTAASKY